MDLEHLPLPGAPLSTYRRQIFYLGSGKRDDTRSILKQKHGELYPVSGPPESNNSTFSLSLLICGF
jgi:hypothetical protein